MSSSTKPATVQRHHHITLSVGGAQEDFDFHTKVLGLKSVKKTALYDGTVPIYHLYYGNDIGEESTLVTCFPMRQSGRKGKKGSGQVTTLTLSVPVSSLGYWKTRLATHGFKVEESERFGEKLLKLQHPCGIDYELAGIRDDVRKPYSHGPVAGDVAIRGTHGITVSARDLEASDEFMNEAWGGRRVEKDGNHVRYVFGDGGSGKIVDFRIDPELAAGSWTFGEGTVHHCAFQVADHSVQEHVKGLVEGLGFTDMSERKDRGYFESMYVRTPAGALFETTVSKPQGFTIDEPYEQLGMGFQVPPVFQSRRDEIMTYLEPLAY